MKEKLIKFIEECFHIGQVPTTASKTFIVSIPKTDKVANFNQLWMISLCNFIL